MRWYLMKSRTLLLLLSLSISFTSCASLKKNLTKTKTETIVKVDTVYHLVYDTVPVIKEGTLYDTIRVEIKTASAVSYYDPIKRTIITKLTGKPFDVPVKFDQHVITTIKEVQAIRKRSPLWFVLIAGTIILITLTIKKRWAE